MEQLEQELMIQCNQLNDQNVLKPRRKEFQIWIKHVSSSCTATGMQPIT
jgi:hypothetical protein